jgi:hypothetical protein
VLYSVCTLVSPCHLLLNQPCTITAADNVLCDLQQSACCGGTLPWCCSMSETVPRIGLCTCTSSLHAPMRINIHVHCALQTSHALSLAPH